jgi:flagellar hook-length control protein FliK
VIVDPKSYVKETNTTGKMSVLIAGKLAEKTADQSGERAAKDTAKAGAGLAAGVEAGVLNKGSDKADVLLNKMAQAGAGKEADALAAQQKGQPAQQTQAMLGESSAADESVLATASKHALGAGKEANGPKASGAGLAGDVATNAAQATGSKVELDAVARSVLDGQKTVANRQGNHSLGEKKAASAGAESIHSASIAATLFQQTKATQPQQVQAQPTVSLAAAGPLGSTEASLADSGSQFSDNRSGQDARSLNAAMVDAKSSGSLTSTSTNFQNYLTNKSTPVLSPFDSMNFIAQSAKNGQTRLEIQLDPVNLGKIHISLQSDASKQLQVHMIVDQGMTRAALEQQLPQLRSALAQQGFDLSGFSMDSQGQQASTGGEGDGRKSQRFSNHTETVTADAAITAPQQQIPTGSGLSIRV